MSGLDTRSGGGRSGGGRSLLRAAARRRALLSAGLAAAAVAAGLSALAPPAPATATVLTAAADLAAGSVLAPEHLTPQQVPVDLVPDGALRDLAAAAGRVVAGPVRRGEPLTDVRLLGAALLPRGSSDVAVPVRLAEPATGALVTAGDAVDVLAAAPDADGGAQVVATRLAVLSVPDLGDSAGEGALVVVRATRATAARLAAAAVSGRLSIVVHGR